jgi:hypothetical protein
VTIIQQLNLPTGTYYRYLAESGYWVDRQQLFMKKYNRKDETDKPAMEMMVLRDRLTEGTGEQLQSQLQKIVQCASKDPG